MPDLQTVTKMATLAANGATTRDIEIATGYDHSTAARSLQTSEAKAIIEAIHSRVINEAVTQGADNIIHAVSKYKSIPASGDLADPQLREHGFKASMEMLRSIGILPSHTQSVMIQNIYNSTTNILSPALSQVLVALAGSYAPPDTLDAEYADESIDNTVDNSGNG
jgi:hypothetical protein